MHNKKRKKQRNRQKDKRNIQDMTMQIRNRPGINKKFMNRMINKTGCIGIPVTIWKGKRPKRQVPHWHGIVSIIRFEESVQNMQIAGKSRQTCCQKPCENKFYFIKPVCFGKDIIQICAKRKRHRKAK